jgi:uncharacterized protein YbjQ (UPF0145 family)
MGNVFRKSLGEKVASENSADRRAGRMKEAKGGQTRSVSAELRQKPDRATAALMRAAEKGDTAAAAQLAKNWKDNH